MKERLGYIKSFIFVFICAIGMNSCVYDSYSDDDGAGDVVDENGLFLVLRISPLSSNGGDNIGNRYEKIKSLRIIILSDGAIEVNEYIDKPEMSASGFNYIRQITAGKKDIYLIANENSVTGIKYYKDDDMSLPADLPTNLYDLLEKYSPNVEGSEAGADFENVINSVYFSSPYNESEEQKNDVYLPYVSHYSDIQVKDNETSDPIQMYLVPVATKFIFNFYNYRPATVNINGISMKSVNEHNFLVPHVGETDLKKTFNGEEYDWIEWLAKVSEASHNYTGFSDNVDFNDKYGWISDYEMPTPTIKKETVFVKGGNEEKYPVSKGINEDTPSTLSLGPYYRPESRNLKETNLNTVEEDGDNEATNPNEQMYYLTLSLKDTAPGETPPEFTDVPISNLKALFRNTCVIINVTMRDGDVEVYTEIQDWNHKYANGWVTEQ